MREFLRRASNHGARKPTESLDRWIDAIAAPRTRAQVLGDLDADDVADPVGGTAEEYRVMLRQLDRLAREIAALF